MLCDGTATNFNVMMLFGCKIGKSLNEINGQFKYPGFEYDLYFTPDPPHMLKLARNALAELECFIDGEGRFIELKYFVHNCSQ